MGNSLVCRCIAQRNIILQYQEIRLTARAFKSSGSRFIIFGWWSRDESALCCGVSGIMEKTQRIWGASTFGTQLTSNAALSSSIWFKASTIITVGFAFWLESVDIHAIRASSSFCGIVDSCEKGIHVWILNLYFVTPLNL